MKTNKLILILLSIVFFSCSEKQEGGELPSGPPIRFNADVEISKSAFVEGSTFADGDEIGVLGYQLPDGVWANNVTPELMYNSRLIKVASGSYRYDPMVSWPLIGKVKFFAYYPHSSFATAGAVTPSPVFNQDYPHVTVVLGKSDDPIDFLTAESDPKGYAETTNGVVNFTFKHRLAKIQYQAKVIELDNTHNLYINRLRVRNIYNKAVFQFDDTGGQWTNAGNESIPDAISGATLKLQPTASAVDKNDFKDLIMSNGTSAYVLMLPQTYDNSELEITYTLEYLKPEGGCEYHIMGTKTIPFSIDWKQGKVYTYQLEFAFKEVSGIQVGLNFSVKDWVERTPIDTEIN